MTKQDQEVGSGGQAIQAGRDVIIGISAAQMTEIMVEMARQLTAFSEEANRRMDERLNEFRAEVLKRFCEDVRGKGNPEAFADPDFQHVLRDAQESYARSGDKAVGDTLVDIIARRSKEDPGTRLALALNDAARKAPILTKNEFAALSLVYVLRYTRNHGVNNFGRLILYLVQNIMPFVPDITKENSSYLHIEAQGCAKVEMGSISLQQLLMTTYGGVLGKGFDKVQLEAHLPNGKKNIFDGVTWNGNPLIIPCTNDLSKLQPNAIDFDTFKNAAAQTGLTEPELQNVWSLFQGTMYSEQELIQKLSPAIPNIDSLFDLWNSTPLKSLSLNTVGMAIAHANAVRVVNFDAELKIWIK